MSRSDDTNICPEDVEDVDLAPEIIEAGAHVIHEAHAEEGESMYWARHTAKRVYRLMYRLHKDHLEAALVTEAPAASRQARK